MSQTSDVHGLTVDNSGNAGKTAEFEEVGTPDEDFEARLYAEIYYSNENYENCESPAAATISQNRVEATGENFEIDTNRRTGEAVAEKSVNERQRFYPSRTWVLGEGSRDAGCVGNKRQPLKGQRLLAYKGLWLPRVETPETQRKRQEFQAERRSAGSFGSARPEETAGFGAVGTRREIEDFATLARRQETAGFGAVGSRREIEDFATLAGRQETGIFGAFGGENEAQHFSPVGSHNVSENFSPVANRNATENFSSVGNRDVTENFSSVGNRNVTENFSPVGNRNVTDNFSSVGNREEAANFAAAVGSRHEDANFAPAVRGIQEAINFAAAFEDRRESANFTAAFEDRRESANFTAAFEDPKNSVNFAAVFEDRRESANFTAASEDPKNSVNFAAAVGNRGKPTNFAAEAVEDRWKSANFVVASDRNETFGASESRNEGPIFGAFTSRTRVTDFKSVRKRPNVSVVGSTSVPGRCFPRFVDDDDDETEKIRPRSSRRLANRFRGSENDRARFPSEPTELENIRPSANRLEAENIFARFASGSIPTENISPIASCLGRVDANFPRLPIDPEFNENSTRVVNPFHEPASNFIRLTPFGKRRNRARNDFSWFGGEAIEVGNSPNRRKKSADYSAIFVADSVETDEDSDEATRLTSENADPTDDSIILDSSRVPSDDLIARQAEERDKRRQNRLIRKRQLRSEKRRKLREENMRSKRPKNPAASVDQSTSSKYKVVSKKNKLDEQMSKLNEPEPVDISSDSDDSILEVPVPPKAPPPVIQLQDSDDEENRGKSAPESSESSTPIAEEAENADNSATPTDSPREPEKSAKNRRKSAQETSEISPQTEETDRADEGDENAGKSAKNRPKKSKKSAGETRRESAASSGSENDSTQVEASAAQSTFSPRVTREAARKKKCKKSAEDPPADREIGEIGDDSVATSIAQQESDEDAGKSAKNRQKKSKKSADEPREENRVAGAAEAADFSADPGEIGGEAKLQKILRDSAKKAKESAANRLPISSPEASGLILNCTEIQKGASSLEEIRRMRESAAAPPPPPICHAHSDDSMTESEASNWVSIAAGQARNSSRADEEICSIGSSIEPIEERSTRENRRVEPSDEVPATTIVAEKSAVSPIAIATARPIDEEPENTRKRQKDSRPFEDFDVPAIPEKRIRQNRPRTSREQTMTEYFFKPMSKELQAFYNNPWGGENLDVYDLQSRMPRNPNHWAILDADLQGPTSRRRKLCPRCKTDSHFGKRCPEKAKPQCCYMCGAQGHTETRCPHTMCLTCGRKYATYRPTCGFCSQLFCTMCNGAGHSCENCPDLWRRYHNTTTETLPMIPRDAGSVMKPAQSLTCCNCARRGHDATTCRQLRWSQHFPTPTYVTSYTAGPTYEPAAPDPRHPSHQSPEIPQNQNRDVDPIVDFTSDSHDLQTTDFAHAEMFYESREPATNVEIIEIPDSEIAVASTPKNPPPKKPKPKNPRRHRVIFQVGETDVKKTAGWQKVTRCLDEFPNLELTGIRAGTQIPKFLVNWEKDFNFSLELFEDDSGSIFLHFCFRFAGARFKWFDRVVWQWLERSDAEKAYLVYEKIPFRAGEKDVNLLRTKLLTLQTVRKPLELLRKINACDRTARQTNAKLAAKTATLSKRDRRRLTAVKTTSEFSMGRRCQLVTALYGGSWVVGGEVSIRAFRKLTRVRENLALIGKTQKQHDYLRLVYLYNEIFTFHESEMLKEALAKVIAAATPEELALMKDELEYPRAEVFDVATDLAEQTENSGDLATNSAGNATDSAANSADLAENATNLAGNATNLAGNATNLAGNATDFAENSTNFAGNATNLAANSASFAENSANTSQNLDDSTASLNFVGDSPLEPRLPIPQADQSVTPRKTCDFHVKGTTFSQRANGNSRLLSSVKKKQRKTYRNKARRGIKAALATGSQKEQAIANALKRKMLDKSVTIGEINELDRALEGNERFQKFKKMIDESARKTKLQRAKARKQRRARGASQQAQKAQQAQQVESTWEVAPTYVNFLRTL